MIMTDSYQDEGSVAAGIGIGFGLNAIVFAVSLTVGLSTDRIDWLARIFYAIALGIGLTQVIYIIPLYLRYQKTGQKNTAKGLVIIASITALLNATCWGLLAEMGGI